MRKVYYRRKRVKWGRLFGVIGVFVLLVAVVAGGITVAATQRKPKFDDSILGTAYVEEEMPIPTATPKPTPKPTGKNVREPKFKAEMVSAYNGDGGKSAYLTFDDGPTTNITPKILDILKEKNAVATFFLSGKKCRSTPRSLSSGNWRKATHWQTTPTRTIIKSSIMEQIISARILKKRSRPFETPWVMQGSPRCSGSPEAPSKRVKIRRKKCCTRKAMCLSTGIRSTATQRRRMFRLQSC